MTLASICFILSLIGVAQAGIYNLTINLAATHGGSTTFQLAGCQEDNINTSTLPATLSTGQSIDFVGPTGYKNGPWGIIYESFDFSCAYVARTGNGSTATLAFSFSVDCMGMNGGGANCDYSYDANATASVMPKRFNGLTWTARAKTQDFVGVVDVRAV